MTALDLSALEALLAKLELAGGVEWYDPDISVAQPLLDSVPKLIARIRELEGGRAALVEEARVNMSRYDNIERHVAELRAENRWIPVGERLPDEHHYVLTWDGVSAREAEWCGDDWLEARDCIVLCDIAHWRELPKGPSAT